MAEINHNINAKEEVTIVRRVTLVGFWINAALVVIKLFFGYWGHSDALVADGYHSLSDFITDFIVIVFVAAAYKKADREHPYGHGKYETFATLMIGLILFIVAIVLGYEGGVSIYKTLHGEILPRPDVWTIVVAGVSILAKEWCYRYTSRTGKRIGSPALVANAWHHRSDAISSIATLIGVSLSYALSEHWRILDPVTSILIAIFIAISAYKIARPSIDELLEISLPPEQIDRMRGIIKRVSGVKRVHNLRARRNGHSYVIDLNIHVDPEITVKAAHIIATDVENALHHEFGHDMIIYVHTEPDD